MPGKNSSRDYDQNTLYEQTLSLIDEGFKLKGEGPPMFLYWCQNSNILLDGNPFSFQGHEYLRMPYEDSHLWIVEEKAAQMGLTSKAMLSVAYGSRYLGYRGIIYFFPSRTDVTELSKGRFNPLIEDNPETVGKWMRETNSATVRQIWNCFVYFRGMRTSISVKNIPADYLIFDELDEAPQRSLTMAMERLAHSRIGRKLMLSNPTLPDYGIDKAFKNTDQRYWLLKCQRCGEYTCLEDTFPDCLLEYSDGRTVRACVKCHSELNPALGEWVAKKPGVTEKHGYHYSQLFSQMPLATPKLILEAFRTTDNLSAFYNLKLGVPYVEAENRIPTEAVISLCGDHGVADRDDGPCSMGVDQGKDLHVVIGRKHPALAGHIIHLGVYLNWEDLDPLMKNFRVTTCVVDALPETRNARQFAKRHKGKVFLNFYNEHQKGSYAWDEGKMVVQCNRTESLDASHHQLLQGAIALPRETDVVREFARHCHNTAKKLEEDEKSGSKRYVYVKLGPDHFRHALNYERMAAELMRGGGISGHVSLGISVTPEQAAAEQKPEETKVVETVPEEFEWVKKY